ncbi:(2Fe-2S)-binding protein [Solitalea longa]|uniref:(2Fe-2S)-binding protein n=1 Tax=Solitalea longa TaxID=2079460 RepID=A0A2S5A572_9SPHI|nr:Rieske 2Fe-2S domain-containing protein [Solitalea longa]POY37437.1 (2Fe-2S)-binding protein [Solitalea longa]
MAEKWIRIDSIEWIKTDVAQNYSIGISIINGRKVCIVKTGEELHAVQNSCPHAGGNLSHGWMEENMLICPIHRHKYNLLTGRGAEQQGDCLKTYELKQTDEGVFIKFTRSFLNPFNWFK